MPDYSKGSIYMIKKQDDFNNDNVYIGSSCNFTNREYQHKRGCNKENNKDYNYKLYQHIRENGGWNSWCMTKIIDYPCNSKRELNTMERSYIDDYKSKLNSNIPTRTPVEYRIDNKEKILENRKKYDINNRDKRLKYYYDNKEKILERIKQYSKDNKQIIAQKKKEYRQNNIEKILEHGKQYRKDNKEEINKKQAIKINCDNCGCEISRNHIARHKRTTRCLNFQR